MRSGLAMTEMGDLAVVRSELWEESMQMDTSFKPGDVVQLNPGGPKMTVAVQSDGTLRCVWFHEDGKQDNGVFAQVALRAAKTKG